MIAWWAIVIYGVVWIIRQIAGGRERHEKPYRASAMDILKERYAKGE